MSYCNTKEEIVTACDFARSVSRSDTVIVENRLDGHGYVVHYVLAQGNASILSFFIMLNQPGYPSNCYSLITSCSNNLNRYLEEFNPYFLEALNKMGAHDGYLWVELREGYDGHLNAIEMAYRMPGDFICDQLKLSGIFNTYSWLLDAATGIKHTKEDLPVSLTALPENIITSYILFSKKGGTISKIEGLSRLAGIPYITLMNTLEVGSQVEKHQYLLIFTLDNKDCYELCDAIQQINDAINIYDENDDNIVIYYDDYKTLYQLDEESKL